MEIGIDSYISSCSLSHELYKRCLDNDSVLFQFWMHTHRPECAIGLMVTRRKMSNFLLVTTASPARDAL